MQFYAFNVRIENMLIHIFLSIKANNFRMKPGEDQEEEEEKEE